MDVASVTLRTHFLVLCKSVHIMTTEIHLKACDYVFRSIYITK